MTVLCPSSNKICLVPDSFPGYHGSLHFSIWGLVVDSFTSLVPFSLCLTVSMLSAYVYLFSCTVCSMLMALS